MDHGIDGCGPVAADQHQQAASVCAQDTFRAFKPGLGRSCQRRRLRPGAGRWNSNRHERAQCHNTQGVSANK